MVENIFLSSTTLQIHLVFAGNIWAWIKIKIFHKVLKIETLYQQGVQNSALYFVCHCGGWYNGEHTLSLSLFDLNTSR